MATFQANPNYQNEIFIERPITEGSVFRVWHVMFFCFAGFVALMILICCCVKLRIPRTKQQIEADYQRKKLADKFRERLKLIQNQEMDTLDLQKALDIIQEDYRVENRSIDGLTTDCNVNLTCENIQLLTQRAEPQQASNFVRNLTNIMRIASPINK